VPSSFYRKAEAGQPATLRLWREEVVGVEVTVARSGSCRSPAKRSATGWAWPFFGLGVLLWGLLFGWDGFFMLAFRTLAWMFMSFVPLSMTTDALAYGLDTGVVSSEKSCWASSSPGSLV